MSHSRIQIDQTWFEMTDIRRRSLSSAIWIPLRVSESTKLEEEVESFVGINSVAIPTKNIDEANKLDWMDIGLIRDAGPYAFRDGRYKPCEVYQHEEGEDFGFDLVFVQNVGGGLPKVWHLSQDLILALNLIEDGDRWVRPEEGYVEAVRRRRDKDGDVVAIEIKNEFLRDYLSARSSALRIASYRERSAVVRDASIVNWPEEGITLQIDQNRFVAMVSEVDAGGLPYGSDVAVFRSWRTDPEIEDDVPMLGPESAQNTEGESGSFRRGGEKFFRISGEYWAFDWVEPAKVSERVRGDEPGDLPSFAIDASGTRASSKELNSEDIGKYLWFNPQTVISILKHQGSGIAWHTRETGSIWLFGNYLTHFGINDVGLLNVYAYDIAKLPAWQQRVWASGNVTPNGRPSRELLDAQVRTQPAGTVAPEVQLKSAMASLDSATNGWLGGPLFKGHHELEKLLNDIHRFRVLESGGLLALAKDIVRVSIERIDASRLRTFSTLSKDKSWGSLKLLESCLTQICSESEAYRLLSPLHKVYDLRIADSHLPSSGLNEKILAIGIDTNEQPIFQALKLLGITVAALMEIEFFINRRAA